MLAHSRPLQLSGEEVRPLETLADHVAAALVSSRTLDLPLALKASRRVDAGILLPVRP